VRFLPCLEQVAQLARPGHLLLASAKEMAVVSKTKQTSARMRADMILL
jgi:hypothetical protein